jgi:UPF0755 protein
MRPTKKLFFFLLFSVLLISFGFYAWQITYTPNVLVGKQARPLIIPRGADFKDVQELLHEGDYTQDLISFSFISKLMEYDEQVKPGRYVLKPNLSNVEAIRILRAGIQEPVNITFNNVRLVKDLSERITRNLNMKPQEFEAALIRFAMNNPYGFNKDNVLTMFIPNTYEVYFNVSPEDLITRMHNEFERFWNEERRRKAEAMDLTPIEVSILASIVQAESIKHDEAPIIAGLYINRLKKGIPLQADPTLIFAVGDFTLKRVLNEHKEIDSPYNTYMYRGLPPGPVNMPEIFALEAVLNYTKSNYLYMCAKEDFSGRHNFTHSYRQHLNNASRYQRALTREMKIAAQKKKQ